MLFREEISLVGAGRTDTGVHATKYYAHFDSLRDDLGKDEEMLFKLNCILPRDIAAQRIKLMAQDNAHARFGAIARTYHYHIVRKKDAFAANRAWELKWRNLDADLMNKGAALLLQYEDFSSFCKTGSDNNTNLCKVTESYWETEGDRMKFVITANRFLRNMIRALVGTLVEVGRGKTSLDELKMIIETRNRSEAGTSAPACGLYLADVRYPKEYGLE
ncbi:MAG: tRNA pseudouridine38-40 synthase [Bacteroidetes bacterium]|nr:MAG: tRNA pseudouridine38-40 synthase [Bacteroidota bacterium]